MKCFDNSVLITDVQKKKHSNHGQLGMFKIMVKFSRHVPGFDFAKIKSALTNGIA